MVTTAWISAGPQRKGEISVVEFFVCFGLILFDCLFFFFFVIISYHFTACSLILCARKSVCLICKRR